nr:ABC-type transport auxiliary lipoprotein family protein [Parvularcula maris]
MEAEPAVPVASRLPVTLAVADARAEGAINTSKIAVRTASNEIRYMPDGEWSDRLPRIVSLLLERAAENQGRLLAVSDRVALPLADYVVYTDIQTFEADRTASPEQVDVIFRVRLENRTGSVLGAQRFSASRPLNDIDTAGVAGALNEAAAAAAADAADWMIGVIEAAEVSREAQQERRDRRASSR